MIRLHANDHTELIEMGFRSELTFYIGYAESIYEGHTVPEVEDGEAVNSKVSQAQERIVIRFRSC